ncbi:MAG: hypothetical protein JW797_09695 [Bradymonadales bacterium]|nr:hypothetical protein [Bradymonadales bacterium]
MIDSHWTGWIKQRFDARELIFDAVILLFATPLAGWIPSGSLDGYLPSWLAVQAQLNVQLMMAILVAWTAGGYLLELERLGERNLKLRLAWILTGVGLAFYSLFAIFFFFLAVSLDKVGPFSVIAGIFVVVLGAIFGGGMGLEAVGVPKSSRPRASGKPIGPNPASPEPLDQPDGQNGEIARLDDGEKPVESSTDRQAQQRDETAVIILSSIVGLNLLLLALQLGVVLFVHLGTVVVILYVIALLAAFTGLGVLYERTLGPKVRSFREGAPGRLGSIVELVFLVLCALAFMLFEHIYLTGKLLSGVQGQTGTAIGLLVLGGLIPVRLLLGLAPPIRPANLPIALVALVVYLCSLPGLR